MVLYLWSPSIRAWSSQGGVSTRWALRFTKVTGVSGWVLGVWGVWCLVLCSFLSSTVPCSECWLPWTMQLCTTAFSPWSLCFGASGSWTDVICKLNFSFKLWVLGYFASAMKKFAHTELNATFISEISQSLFSVVTKEIIIIVTLNSTNNSKHLLWSLKGSWLISWLQTGLLNSGTFSWRKDVINLNFLEYPFWNYTYCPIKLS